MPSSHSPWASFAGIFIVTNLGLLAVGATLPVLPNYIKDELGGSDLEVGIVTGAFAFTGIICRPIAGNLADRRGRKPTVIGGASLAAIAGALLFVPASIPGLFVSRLFLGAGEGTVFTAGSAWNVDMAPEERRARMIGLYGLAIWTGLTLGPPIGVLLQDAGGFNLVWAFAAAAPLLGALVASRLPESAVVGGERSRGPFISREALGPGGTFALGVVGFAAVSAFIVLSLDERGIGHGAEVFSVFAGTVVATRLVAGGLPDRIGRARCAVGAALVEAIGLVLLGAAETCRWDRRARWGWARPSPCSSRALAARRRPGGAGAPRRGDGHLHRRLRPRHAGGLARGRRGGRAGRLQRRLLSRRGCRVRVRDALGDVSSIGAAAALELRTGSIGGLSVPRRPPLG